MRMSFSAIGKGGDWGGGGWGVGTAYTAIDWGGLCVRGGVLERECVCGVV